MLDSKVSQINVFRLVLSNQSKKWISADGVEKIQLVSEVTLLLAYYSLFGSCTFLMKRSFADPNDFFSDPDPT